MSILAKSAVAVSIPAVTWVSPGLGIAMTLGLMGGWLARAGISKREGKTWAQVGEDALINLMFAVGSVIATLVFARLAHADELGIASIGFIVGLSGDKSFEMLRNYVFAPILAAIRKTENEE